MLLVRLKSILNGVIDEIPDYGNVDPAVFLKTGHKSEGFSEGKLISINEESGCDESIKMCQRKSSSKKFPK